jgi:hypothetical protein
MLATGQKEGQVGTPTGDILDAVIAGIDRPINDKVKTDIAKLQTLDRLSNDISNSAKMCRQYEKIEAQMDGAKLMKCQRCKVAYYCSKECQVADWKHHTKECSAVISWNQESRSTLQTSATTMEAFMTSNYFAIAKEVYKKTQEYSIPKKEVFVVVDFFGNAPALQNKVQVWLTSDFLKESAPVDSPHWCRAVADEKTLTLYERMTRDELLAVCLASNGIMRSSNFSASRLPIRATSPLMRL